MSLWDPDARDYAVELSKWCHQTGKMQFFHHELPERLQSTNAALLQKARDRGYVRKVRRERWGTLWELSKVVA